MSTIVDIKVPDIGDFDDVEVIEVLVAATAVAVPLGLRLFDPLYRVDTVRHRATGGYGLGLAIARRAIEQHGGELQAINTGDGLRVIANLPAE